MTSIYTNVLSNEELDYLNNHPEVLVPKLHWILDYLEMFIFQ